MQSETTKESFDFDRFMVWLHANRKPVAIGAAVVAAVAVTFAIYTWKKNQNELDANAALFALPSLVGSSGRTAQVRAEDFQKVAQEYPETRTAARAELIAAGVSFTSGNYAEAEKQFTKILNERVESPFRAQAALGVAASLEAQGKTAEAVAKYQELITKYTGESIVPPAKLTLARLFETQNKPEEALKLYEELARSNNPDDPWSAEARERREQLFQRLPNLKMPPGATIPSAPKTAPAIIPDSSATKTNVVAPK
jgi:predicted negative regulator of RcsB-dependent stress response